MSASRLLLLVVGLAAGLYIVKNYSGIFSAGSPKSAAGPAPASPIDRARAARDASDRQTAAGESMAREADQAPAAGVTENMTPEQVRALLGPPDDVEKGTLDNGGTRETWTYRAAGKTVIFENGVAVSIR
jgi:hypothetical protein